MIQQTLPPPVWVDKPATFNQMVADLSAQSRIAVDTESNSLHAYREKVCLVQFSTLQEDFLVAVTRVEEVLNRPLDLDLRVPILWDVQYGSSWVRAAPLSTRLMQYGGTCR